MVAIDGRPLIDIWLDSFDTAGIDEVLVNLHHLPDVVRHHIAARSGPPAVRIVFEPELRSLIDAHREHGAVATLTVFRSENPSAGGVVHPSLLAEIDGPRPKDIGYDLLPRLVGRAKAMLVEGYFRDIGTVDAYRRAQKEWPVRAGRATR